MKGGANKNAMKLGLNDIIDLFRPTATVMFGEGSTVGEEKMPQQQQRRSEGRKGVPMLGGMKREESATYGRRW